MSRVYDALRQSEIEQGSATGLLDPNSFLPASTNASCAEVAPALAVTPLFPWDEVASFKPLTRLDSRLVAFTDDASLGAEKFRLLRARLRHLRETQPLRRIVISSAVPDEGKTLVSMNLAISLAKHTSERILLLEGDLRKPMLAEHLGLPSFGGLDNWFFQDGSIGKYIYRLADSQLWILSAGETRSNPLGILQSERFLELYGQLGQAFDWILIDAPPLLPMADVNFWSRQADGLLLVAREGRTPKQILQKGLEVLDSPRIIGVVLNEAHSVERSYYHHYYGRSQSTQTS